MHATGGENSARYRPNLLTFRDRRAGPPGSKTVRKEVENLSFEDQYNFGLSLLEETIMNIGDLTNE